MSHSDPFASARQRMVAEQIEARGVRDPRVIQALRRVPRHLFVPPEDADFAYDDAARPIPSGQTISQPYIVALMTESLHLRGHETVLEIGAGSGYQTAVLAGLCARIVAVERHAELAAAARARLARLNILNVELHVGDGSLGWPDDAPYDAILVAASAPDVPPALVRQLAPGGRLIVPVGPEGHEQHLLLLTRDENGMVATRDLGPVAFVPLIGAQGHGLPEDFGVLDV
jgi:protein-L-isoaspartate(D-aspartate) O-methyltransferase